MHNQSSDKKKKTPKQIAALICVALLVGMYVATLVVAFLDFPKTYLFSLGPFFYAHTNQFEFNHARPTRALQTVLQSRMRY